MTSSVSIHSTLGPGVPYPLTILYRVPFDVFCAIHGFSKTTIRDGAWECNFYPGRHRTTVVEWVLADPEVLFADLAFLRMVTPRTARALRSHRKP